MKSTKLDERGGAAAPDLFGNVGLDLVPARLAPND